jgi:hypothetical protein
MILLAYNEEMKRDQSQKECLDPANSDMKDSSFRNGADFPYRFQY